MTYTPVTRIYNATATRNLAHTHGSMFEQTSRIYNSVPTNALLTSVTMFVYYMEGYYMSRHRGAILRELYVPC
jgi:hypothetical protein